MRQWDLRQRCYCRCMSVTLFIHKRRDHSGDGLDQWEKVLHGNASSHCPNPPPPPKKKKKSFNYVMFKFRHSFSRSWKGTWTTSSIFIMRALCDLTLPVVKPAYSKQKATMPRPFASPCHQQPCYWLCKIGWILSSLGNITVTSQWVRWRLKWSGSRLFWSIVCSGAVQRKHQSSTSLAFVRGIDGLPVDSPHKGPITLKRLPFEEPNAAESNIHQSKCR